VPGKLQSSRPGSVACQLDFQPRRPAPGARRPRALPSTCGPQDRFSAVASQSGRERRPAEATL
jgi:hypothetical protein